MAEPTPSNPSWAPAPPAPPGWSAAPPTVSASAQVAAASPNAWNPTPAPAYVPFWKHAGAMVSLSRLLKMGGLAFVVVGLLVVVAGANVPGSCTTSNCSSVQGGTNWVGGALWAIMIGEIFLVLGFAGVATGAMMKIRADTYPASGRREELDFVLADRRWNGQLIVVSLLLLFATLVIVILSFHTTGLAFATIP